MDSILDAIGDISEPVTDFLGLTLDKESTLYTAKWGSYILKILIAVYLIGSAVWNIYTNQSFLYMVNENGIFKIAVNLFKIALAFYMLDKFNLKLQSLASVVKSKDDETQKKTEQAKAGGVAGLGIASEDGAYPVSGFSGWYNMFKSEVEEL